MPLFALYVGVQPAYFLRTLLQRTKKYLVLFALSFFILSPVNALEFDIWFTYQFARPQFSSAKEGCDYFHTKHFEWWAPYYNPAKNYFDTPDYYRCGQEETFAGEIRRRILSCKDGEVPDFHTGECSNLKQKGAPEDPMACNTPSNFVGNPINSSNGNKFHEETSYDSGGANPILFKHYYNSIDGVWSHSYSSSLYFAAGAVVVISEDGRQSVFIKRDNKYISSSDNGTVEEAEGGWNYTSSSDITHHYTAEGLLMYIKKHENIIYTLARSFENSKFVIRVSNSAGITMYIVEDSSHQPISVTTGKFSMFFKYEHGRLANLKKTYGAEVFFRQYHYEDTLNNGLLTGITDERGVRIASWTYDTQGRAISSQHSGGAGLTQITYNPDGSSTVINELGKSTVYRYQLIGGVRRVTSIEGEPSPNCPASNSSYTYNDSGKILSKTDARGLITTYTYNERGLETSRTEAHSTALDRTTTTEWEPNRFLPSKVIGPTRTTVYSYDDQGRELSRQTTSH